MPAHGSQLCMRHKFSTAWGGPGTIMGLNMHATIALPALLGEASESALSQHQGVVGWVENVRCGMSSSLSACRCACDVKRSCEWQEWLRCLG